VEGELAIMSTVLDTLQQLGISVDDAEVNSQTSFKYPMQYV
jgi:hypothetical protein